MVKLILNWLAGMLFLVSATHAGTVRIACAQNGQIDSLTSGNATTDLKPAEQEDRFQASKSFGEMLCERLNTCFASFPALGQLSSVVAQSVQDIQKQYIRTADRQDAVDEMIHLVRSCEGQFNQRPQKDDILPIGDIRIQSTRGLNRNKTGTFDGKALAGIIDQALLKGVDPYLALGISIVENPQYAGDKKSHDYAASYGDVPVDATGAFAAMGCLKGGDVKPQFVSASDFKTMTQLKNTLDAPTRYRESLGRIDNGKINEYLESPEKKELLDDPVVVRFAKLKAQADGASGEMKALVNGIAQTADVPDKKALAAQIFRELSCATSSECIGMIEPPPQPVTLNFSALPDFDLRHATVRQVCNSTPAVWVGSSPDFDSPSGACCARVAGSGDPQALLRNSLGAKYIKDEVQSCIAQGDKSLAYCIQKYNGLGCFGCSEKMKNQCLYKLQMKTHPIYGAKVGDMMVASLMTNPDVNALVARERLRMKVPAVSMFCLNGRAGSQNIDTDQFYRQQKQILGGRPQCRGQL